MPTPSPLQRALEWTVQYEGDWVQGRREGHGTRYYSNGETYTGHFAANLRHGSGRYEYESGDVYAGQWLDDKRQGAGTVYFGTGDIFIGNFMLDRREGLGTLYMMSRQKKYIAEYVADSPRCGTVMEIDDADLAPIKGHLAQLAVAHKLDKMAAGEAVLRLPELQLQQPNKVLAAQVVAVRCTRAAGSKALREVQVRSQRHMLSSPCTNAHASFLAGGACHGCLMLLEAHCTIPEVRSCAVDPQSLSAPTGSRATGFSHYTSQGKAPACALLHFLVQGCSCLLMSTLHC